MGVVYGIAGVILFLYVGIPLIVKATLKIRGRYPKHPAPVEQVPPEVQRYIGEIGPSLTVLGFEFIGYVAPPGSGTIQPFMAYWLNRQTGQRATANTLHAFTRTPPSNVKEFLQFSTTFADGRQIMTANSDAFDFNGWPGLDFLHASMAIDPKKSFTTCTSGVRCSSHRNRFRVTSSHRATSLKIFAPSKAEIEYGMRRQVSTGRFKTNRWGENVPTFRGAFALVWQVLPPISNINKTRERRRAREQIRAAEAAPVSPPAHVQITHVSPYLK